MATLFIRAKQCTHCGKKLCVNAAGVMIEHNDRSGVRCVGSMKAVSK